MTGRLSPFLACSNYPKCNTLLNLSKLRHIEPIKTPPITTELAYANCGAPMYLRTGKRGLWLGCSKFPKCRGRLSWNTLDEATQLRWEKIMNDHMAAHPAVTITMLDGTPAPMNLPIEDIILRAEDAGLISAPSEQQEETEATA